MLSAEVSSSLSIATTNLLSIPVLAFLLGVLAARLRSDLRLPDSAYRTVSMILLFAIGLKGGVALRQTDTGDLVLPVAATIVLGIVIPVAAFAVLRLLTPLGRMDRGSIAAHYGSTSLVTFTACLVLLESSGVPFEGFMPTLLTVMEIPGIIVGLLLATARSADGQERGSWRHGLLEVLTSRSVVLLVGGLVVGAISGPVGYERVEPLFGGLFQGLLALFLLHLGTMVGQHLSEVRSAGWGLLGFAVGFPIVVGAVGVATGTLIGLSIGGATVLGVLCASASYIAAPAAVRIALPRANETIALTSSLAITFPFNLTIGIPLLLALAQRLGAAA
jgi:hypothetical protein